MRLATYEITHGKNGIQDNMQNADGSHIIKRYGGHTQNLDQLINRRLTEKKAHRQPMGLKARHSRLYTSRIVHKTYVTDDTQDIIRNGLYSRQVRIYLRTQNCSAYRQATHGIDRTQTTYGAGDFASRYLDIVSTKTAHMMNGTRLRTAQVLHIGRTAHKQNRDGQN